MKHIFITKLFLITIFFVYGCGGSSVIIQPGTPPKQSYDKAMKFFQEGRYDKSIEIFEVLTSYVRGTPLYQDIQIHLALAYYHTRQYLLAVSELDNYIIQYTSSERREEAEYYRILSYVKLSPRPSLGQEYTLKALEYIALFRIRYETSDYLNEIAQYAEQLRSKLANKYYDIGKFYEGIDVFEGAITYYNITIERYPETIYAELSLVSVIRTYLNYASKSVPEKQKDRYNMVLENCNKYFQIFPSGKYYGQVQKYHKLSLSILEKV